MFSPKLPRTLLAAETVFPSSDQFGEGYSSWDEYVTDRILDHLVLFILWSMRGGVLPAILNLCIESTKHLSE
ncbi:MAG: hypothetical protein A4C66_03110 [Nitrospira sp. HN-bin3]|nr:MAG: hypothetical protein A4C66_03110 [Nitrospira sp. HN-bin3]